jgi:hypothetical protein
MRTSMRIALTAAGEGTILRGLLAVAHLPAVTFSRVERAGGRGRSVAMLGIALLLVGCSSPGPGETPQSSAAPTQVAAETDPPWPAAFAEKFCIAVSQATIVESDVQVLGTAVAAGDVDAVGARAISAALELKVMDIALSEAPTWAPAAPVVAAMREALPPMAVALNDISVGVADADPTKISSGWTTVAAQTALLNAAMARVKPFEAETGLSCG